MLQAVTGHQYPAVALEQHGGFGKLTFFEQKKLCIRNRWPAASFDQTRRLGHSVAIRTTLAPEFRAVAFDVITVIHAMIVTETDHVFDRAQAVELTLLCRTQPDRTDHCQIAVLARDDHIAIHPHSRSDLS